MTKRKAAGVGVVALGLLALATWLLWPRAIAVDLIEVKRAPAVRMLAVNGTIRQQADLGDMIWSVAEIVAELSTYVALEPGDLIFTGTPAGVGAVVRGDTMEGSIAGLGTLKVAIV